MTEEKKIKKPHSVILENRRNAIISGVEDVDSFDESSVVLFTDLGTLTVKGDNLHINKLSVESGDVAIEGEIYSVQYQDDTPQNGGSFFSKLFK